MVQQAELENAIETCGQQKTINAINALPATNPSIKDLFLAVWNEENTQITPHYYALRNSSNSNLTTLTNHPFILLKSLFRIAISRNDIKALEKLFTISPPPQPTMLALTVNDSLQLNGLTADMWACTSPLVWELMLRNGFMSQDRGAGLSNPLSHFLHLRKENYREIAALMVQFGAQVGVVPVRAAVKMADVELLDVLWKGYSQNSDDDGNQHDQESDLRTSRLLHEAIAYGHVEVVEWLLDVAKIDIDLIPADGPRVELEEFNRSGVAESNGTPLHEAVIHNQVEILRLLLKRGASRKVKNEAGNTPFEEARRRGLWIASVLLIFG